MAEEKKLSFQDCDVAESQNSQYRDELIEKSGQISVPVVDFGGEIVLGFNEKRFEEALEKAKKNSLKYFYLTTAIILLPRPSLQKKCRAIPVSTAVPTLIFQKIPPLSSLQ